MAKLELWFPCKPLGVFQEFGPSILPSLQEKYVSIGLAGHNGWDMLAPTGTIVRASHDGVVMFTGSDGSGGQVVVLRTSEQYDYNGVPTYFKTVYAHLKMESFMVKPGQTVKIGDPLALSNNTGFSTGPHLHFALKPIYQGEQDWVWENVENNNGYRGAIDPAPYWVGYFAEDRKTVIAIFISQALILSKQILEKLSTKNSL